MVLTDGCTSEPWLQQGSYGDCVGWIQRRLTLLGYDPGPIDCDFGPVTRSTVEAFQRDKGLVIDGIVGPETWKALKECPSPIIQLIIDEIVRMCKTAPIEKCEGILRPTPTCPYILSNNRWGNENAETCVFVNDKGVGWRWYQKVGAGWIYPGAVIGTNFCYWESTWNKFPIKWGDIQSWNIELEWNYITHPYPNYVPYEWNLAFDIYYWDYACNIKKMNPMVWVQFGGWGGYLTSGPTVTDGINYYYYDRPAGDWPRIIYALKGQNPDANSGYIKIDMKRLLSNIPELQSSWVIDGIHLGNENVKNGSKGEIQITKYDMELNGSKIFL